LGDLISYTISMKNGTITCTVNGVSTTETLTTAFYSNTDNYYFKAGNYFGYNNVDAGSSTVVNGINKFYKLSLVKQFTGLKETETLKCVCFPNPVKDKLNKNCDLPSASKVRIDIIDLTGKTLKIINPDKVQTTDNLTLSVDVTALKNGIYFARINSENLSKTIKFSVDK
jgi:hypothetical protein